MKGSVLVAAAGAVLTLAACSSGGGSSAAGHTLAARRPATFGASSHATAAGGCAPDVVARICLTAAITGKASVTGSAQTTAPAPPEAEPDWTCAKLATFVNGDTDLGASANSVGGHALQWDGTVPGFHGPGTYSLSGTEFYVTVDGVGYSAAKSELLQSDPSASVTIDPHFAVHISFTDLQGQTTADRISGSLNWTCVDPE